MPERMARAASPPTRPEPSRHRLLPGRAPHPPWRTGVRTVSYTHLQAVRMIWAAMDGSTSEDGVQEAEAERRSSSTMNPHRSQPPSLWSVRVLMSLTILVNSRLSSSTVSYTHLLDGPGHSDGSHIIRQPSRRERSRQGVRFVGLLPHRLATGAHLHTTEKNLPNPVCNNC